MIRLTKCNLRQVIYSTLSGLALTTVIASQAVAQLEEIVVTAQRKAESLQDVPIAISALSQETIEKTGTHELGGIALQVPGLTFSSFSPGQNIVSLRGASSNDDGAGTDGSVAVFVDDVYLGRISNINPELFDLERIEVLRGPQGTLYGKNTIGGAINIVSTRPNLERLTGKIKVGLGNYERRELAGLISGPLISDRVAFKLSASLRERDGWANNRVLNKEQKDDNAGGLKAQILFDNGKDFEALLSFDYNELDIEDMGRVPLRPNYDGIGSGGPNPATFRRAYEATCGDVTGSKCVADPVNGYAKREAYGVSSKLQWEFGTTAQLLSITAYRDSESDWNMGSSGGGLVLNDDIFDTTEQISQEFRFLHSPADNLDYVVGFWYLNEETDRTECFDLNGAGRGVRGTVSAMANTDCTPLTDGSEGYNQINKTTSIALFGQVNIHFNPALTLSLGGRYSSEEKEIISRAVTNEVSDSAGSCIAATASGLCIIAQSLDPLTIDESWSAFTPKISLNFAPTDATNFYVTYSRGFKSGGFPAAPQTPEDARRVLDQEEATNYEAGFKGLLGGFFRIGVAIFYTEYEGLQLQNFGTPRDQEGTFGRFLTFNAGDAEVSGLEAEGTLLINNNLTLSGFVSYNDSEFGETDIANAAANSNQEGQELLRTPELKWGLTVDQLIPLKDGSSINLNLTYNYSGDQRADLPSYAVQPEFELMDFRASWTSAHNLEVAGWVKNLLDEEYVSHIYTIAGGSVTGIYGNPRMYGVSVTYSF